MEEQIASTLILMADPESMACNQSPCYVVPAGLLSPQAQLVLDKMDGNFTGNSRYIEMYDAIVTPLLTTLCAAGQAHYLTAGKITLPDRHIVTRIIMICIGANIIDDADDDFDP